MTNKKKTSDKKVEGDPQEDEILGDDVLSIIDSDVLEETFEEIGEYNDIDNL